MHDGGVRVSGQSAGRVPKDVGRGVFVYRGRPKSDVDIAKDVYFEIKLGAAIDTPRRVGNEIRKPMHVGSGVYG